MLFSASFLVVLALLYALYKLISIESLGSRFLKNLTVILPSSTSSAGPSNGTETLRQRTKGSKRTQATTASSNTEASRGDSIPISAVTLTSNALDGLRLPLWDSFDSLLFIGALSIGAVLLNDTLSCLLGGASSAAAGALSSSASVLSARATLALDAVWTKSSSGQELPFLLLISLVCYGLFAASRIVLSAGSCGTEVQTAGVVGSASFLLALTLLIAAPDWLLDVSLRDSFARWVASLNDTMSAMQVDFRLNAAPIVPVSLVATSCAVFAFSTSLSARRYARDYLHLAAAERVRIALQSESEGANNKRHAWSFKSSVLMPLWRAFEQSLAHAGFVAPLIVSLMWVRPMTRDILVSSSGVEGMMSADTYDRVRMWITVVGCVLRLISARTLIQSYCCAPLLLGSSAQWDSTVVSGWDYGLAARYNISYLPSACIHHLAPTLVTLALSLIHKHKAQTEWGLCSPIFGGDSVHAVPDPSVEKSSNSFASQAVSFAVFWSQAAWFIQCCVAVILLRRRGTVQS